MNVQFYAKYKWTSFLYWTNQTTQNSTDVFPVNYLQNGTNDQKNLSTIELTNPYKIKTNFFPLLNLQNRTTYKWTSFPSWTYKTIQNINSLFPPLHSYESMQNKNEHISFVELTKPHKIRTNVVLLLNLRNHTKYKWRSFLYCTYKFTQNTNGRLSVIVLTKPHKIQMDVFPLLYLQSHTKYKRTSFLYSTCKITQNTNERLSFIQLAKPTKHKWTSFLYWTYKTIQYTNDYFPYELIQITNEFLSFIELIKSFKIHTNAFPLLILQSHTKYKRTSFLYWTYKTTQNTNGRISFFKLTKLCKYKWTYFLYWNFKTTQNTNEGLSFIELTKLHKIQTNVFPLLNLQNDTKYKGRISFIELAHPCKLQTNIFPF